MPNIALLPRYIIILCIIFIIYLFTTHLKILSNKILNLLRKYHNKIYNSFYIDLNNLENKLKTENKYNFLLLFLIQSNSTTQ